MPCARAHAHALRHHRCAEGANTVVKGCIIDKNARIGANCRITNAQGIVEARREEHGYCIRDGILTVLRNGTIADNTII